MFLFIWKINICIFFLNKNITQHLHEPQSQLSVTNLYCATGCMFFIQMVRGLFGESANIFLSAHKTFNCSQIFLWGNRRLRDSSVLLIGGTIWCEHRPLLSRGNRLSQLVLFYLSTAMIHCLCRGPGITLFTLPSFSSQCVILKYGHILSALTLGIHEGVYHQFPDKAMIHEALTHKC